MITVCFYLCGGDGDSVFDEYDEEYFFLLFFFLCFFCFLVCLRWYFFFFFFFLLSLELDGESVDPEDSCFLCLYFLLRFLLWCELSDVVLDDVVVDEDVDEELYFRFFLLFFFFSVDLLENKVTG